MLHGPAGAGKTTLTAVWARTCGLSVTWVDAHPGDDLTHLTGNTGNADTVEAGRGTPRLLVVDGAERLSPEVVTALGRYIDEHEAVRAVLTTRTHTTIQLLGLATDAELHVIGPADLRLDLDEIAEALPGRPSEEHARLLDVSDGLVVAIRAALDSVPTRLPDRFRRDLVRDLDDQPAELRQALLRLGVIGEMDRTSADALAISWRWIEQAERTGLGSLDQEWFTLSGFGRQVLDPLVASEVSEATRAHWIGVAVRSSLAQHRPVVALRLALAIGDHALASDVAISSCIELLEHHEEAYRLLSGMRVTTFTRFPALVVLFALLSNMSPATRSRALEIFGATALRLRIRPGAGCMRDRAIYRAFEASALRVTPLAERSLPLVRRALTDLDELPAADFRAAGRLGPTLYTHLGISAMYCGDTRLAARCFEDAHAKHIEAGYADACDPLSLRGGLCALLGEVTTARRLLAAAEEAPWPEGWRTSSPADFLELGHAVVALEDGDPEAAQRHLDAVGPFEELVEHWPVFAMVQAWHDASVGDPHGGLARMQAIAHRRRTSPTTTFARGIVDATEAELRLLSGNLTAARRLAVGAAKHTSYGAIVLARIQIAHRETAAALSTLGRVLAGRHLSPRLAVEAGRLVACACLGTGHQRDGDAAVAYLSELAISSGMRALMTPLTVTERDLLLDSAERLGREEIVQALMTAQIIGPLARPVEVAPLTERELIVLNALYDMSSTAQIAGKLHVSPNTVKTQLRSLYRKLGVSSREAALTRAAALGLPRTGPQVPGVRPPDLDDVSMTG